MLKTQKSTRLTKEKHIPAWWILDLNGQTLGRVATRVADILRGKHRPIFTPNVDGGDFIVAVNADKIKLTGKKWSDKKYYNHSGYPGGLRTRTAEEVQKGHPEELLTLAVKGMLPKNDLARSMLKKLKVFGGESHPYISQKLKKLEIR